MVKIHPQIIEKDGKKEFVVLPYEEFIRVQNELEDYEDLRLLRQAKNQEKDKPSHTLEEAK